MNTYAFTYLLVWTKLNCENYVRIVQILVLRFSIENPVLPALNYRFVLKADKTFIGRGARGELGLYLSAEC